MNADAPVVSGRPFCFAPRPSAIVWASLLLILLFLSRGGSDRLLLLSGYLVGGLFLGRCALQPSDLLGTLGRRIALAAAGIALAGVAVSPVPRTAAFIGLDLLFPALLALCAAALLPRPERAWLLVLAGAAEGAVVLVQWALTATRPSGTFGNPNYAALVMVVGALVALDSAEASRRWRLPRAAAAGIAILGVVATGSKSAFAALAAGIALFTWRLPSRWRLAPVAGLALLLLLPNPLSNRLLHSAAEDPYAFQRPMIWSMALEAWGEHPVTGLGPGGFAIWARINNRPVETTPTRFGLRPETAHNQPLQTALDYGLPGLILLALIVWLLARDLARRLRSGDRGAFAPAAVLAASLPAAALFPILESPPLLLFLALGLTLHRGPCDATTTATDAAGRILRTAVPTLLALLLATEGIHMLGARLRSIPLLTIASVIPPQNPARWQDLAAVRAGAAPPGDRRAIGEALAYLSMAMQISPEDPDTFLRRADLLVSRLNAGERHALLVLDLLRTLNGAAQRDPRNPFIPFTSGGIQLRIGQNDLARRDLARAVALEPNFLAARARLAESLDALGMEKEAAAERRTVAVLAKRWENYSPRSPYERSILAAPPRAVDLVPNRKEER